MSKLKVPKSWLSHLILQSKTLNPNLKNNPILHLYKSIHYSSKYPFQFNPNSTKSTFYLTQTRHFYGGFDTDEEDQAIQELEREIEKEKNREREAKRKAGIVVNDVDEEEEDYMGVGPLIDQIDKECAKPKTMLDKFKSLEMLDEPTDSDSEDDEEEDFELMEEERKGEALFDRMVERHEELLKSFQSSATLDEAFKWMAKINKFEEKHFRLLPEYRVIGELLNRFKDSTGKEKFLLAQKLNRAMRLVQWKEEFDPNDPSNYGVIQREEDGEVIGEDEIERERPLIEGGEEAVEDEEVFDDTKERGDILLEKVNAIDKMLEEKLSALDYTFGKKGRALEEEIRNLAEERNALTEKKKRPMYRKGFDTKLIDVNRTCKVTKGGQVVKYTAIIVCGNYNGIIGYAKAKGPAVPIAIQKAYEKCFQNLHYVDRYMDHTIAHAIQTSYKKTKIYLWPAETRTGVTAGNTVQTILNLAGFKDVKSKVIGSRNPQNTVKAVFQALNAIETPKDVQEKFGRTVVETYLL